MLNRVNRRVNAINPAALLNVLWWQKWIFDHICCGCELRLWPQNTIGSSLSPRTPKCKFGGDSPKRFMEHRVYWKYRHPHTHTAGQQQNIIPPLSMVGASIKIPTKASLWKLLTCTQQQRMRGWSSIMASGHHYIWRVFIFCSKYMKLQHSLEICIV